VRDGDDSTRETGVELLRALDLFATLPGAELEQLTRALVRLAFAPGAVIVREGDEAEYFYIVAAGRVEFARGAQCIAIRGPGECFGGAALLGRRPQTATAVAGTHITLYALDGPRFLAAVASEPTGPRVESPVVTDEV
jgi:CRP-like cAMP-binding protein